jgi:hypothetical protein
MEWLAKWFDRHEMGRMRHAVNGTYYSSLYKEENRELAESIYNGLKERGLVLLDKDQSLPEYPRHRTAEEYALLMNTHQQQYEQAQQDMLSNNWRKVKE